MRVLTLISETSRYVSSGMINTLTLLADIQPVLTYASSVTDVGGFVEFID